MTDTLDMMDLDDVVAEQLATECWMRSNLKVLSLNDKLIPYEPREAQNIIYKAISLQRRAGKPVRLIILKSRREGVSTCTAGYFFARTHLKPYHQAFVSAHDDEGCKTQWKIVERFEANLPANAKLPVEHGTAHELTFCHPHAASYRVQTAGNEKMGSGAGYTDLHLSELAKWAHDQTALNSIMQTVPDKPHTTVIIESTANGASGTFYEMWQAAVRRQQERPGDLDGFLPIFFTALTPEHSMTAPAGYTFAGMDEDELRWKDAGATPEQLYWRRYTIDNKCSGKVDLFNQEYPLDPEVAFLASGRPAIDPVIVNHHKSMKKTPDRAILVQASAIDETVTLDYGQYLDHQGGWDIWEGPEDGIDYTIGCDPCTGIPSDPGNPYSDPDYHAIVVQKREPKRIVAIHHSRMDADKVGIEMLKAARLYNSAWATPEICEGSGMTILNVLRNAGYPRIYMRDAEGDSVDLENVAKLGWKTTRNTREWMIDDWIAACRKDPNLGWDFTMEVPCDSLIEEESSFVWNGDKREHRSGSHDDILFAAMIALQLDKRCCRTHTFKRVGVKREDPCSGPRYFNGRDPGIPEAQKDYVSVHAETLS